ncbi:hypothetical protein [Halopiger xanaduensis]|uniref:Uncharacterized protein n=1 Tax=Halopiger xanaduensis (strain DSM 18323 / JCM 14033 / SH-6) TaxID=797210 RepID=F8D689_HALXS|nr:hypothetical protein [Halopiger xanaduensis]AEH35335.1 hypothetical protein Halxa_0696 [Halopiger xanaduensis SH-6]
MNARDRIVVGTIWIAVAGLMATTLELDGSLSAGLIARLVVILVALFLAAVYLFDPWGLLSRQPFH